MEKVKKHIKEKQLTVSRHWKSLLIFGVVFFTIFIIFTFMVRANMLTAFDFDATVRLQDDIPLRFDSFFSTISILGRFEYTFGAFVLALLFRRRILGIIPFFLFGFAHVIELIGKTILEHPGPPRMFLRSQFGDFPGLYVFTNGSYPSGHSLRIVFLSIVFTYFIFNFKRLPKHIRFALFALIFAVFFIMLVSRVSLGEHWTTDVIGGGLLGASFAFLALIFL